MIRATPTPPPPRKKASLNLPKLAHPLLLHRSIQPNTAISENDPVTLYIPTHQRLFPRSTATSNSYCDHHDRHQRHRDPSARSLREALRSIFFHDAKTSPLATRNPPPNLDPPPLRLSATPSPSPVTPTPTPPPTPPPRQHPRYPQNATPPPRHPRHSPRSSKISNITKKKKIKKKKKEKKRNKCVRGE